MVVRHISVSLFCFLVNGRDGCDYNSIGFFGIRISYCGQVTADLPEILASRGFKANDVPGIMHGNWVRFLHNAWT